MCRFECTDEYKAWFSSSTPSGSVRAWIRIFDAPPPAAFPATAAAADVKRVMAAALANDTDGDEGLGSDSPSSATVAAEDADGYDMTAGQDATAKAEQAAWEAALAGAVASPSPLPSVKKKVQRRKI